MTVARIEWQCPGCERKFAIPANQPRPKLCPHCQQTATAIPKRPAQTPPIAAYADEPVIESELDFNEAPPESSAFVGGGGSLPSRPAKRRRYGELRSLSGVLKIMAGLIGLLTIVMLFESIHMLMDAPTGDVRRYLVYYSLGIMIGGATATISVYAFAVLLLMAMDIEHNTRRD
jgi:hypothetical protein